MTAGFDPARFAPALATGHGGRLGVAYHGHGPGWVELALPWRADFAEDADGRVATGAIATLMDMAGALAVWTARGRFVPHATLDLRIDHLRGSRTGATLIGHGECYRITGPLAFVRGWAHDGDAADPVAHVVGSFMTTGTHA